MAADVSAKLVEQTGKWITRATATANSYTYRGGQALYIFTCPVCGDQATYTESATAIYAAIDHAEVCRRAADATSRALAAVYEAACALAGNPLLTEDECGILVDVAGGIDVVRESYTARLAMAAK